MHKNTRLLPYMRRAIYEAWLSGQSITDLGKEYKITRPIVYKILERAKLNEFQNRRSVNKRFKTIKYGLKKLNIAEKRLRKKIERNWIRRYEKNNPGEMVHFDTKRLPLLWGEARISKREHLHVALDDYSRYLVADIFPDKGQYSSAMHLEETINDVPFEIECAFSDNGSAYRGRRDHAFVDKCIKNKIYQGFTRTRRPQTNGKAERVIRTLMEEWHIKGKFNTREERRKSLQEFVLHYNFKRQHSGINNLTPVQRITNYLSCQSVYNA